MITTPDTYHVLLVEDHAAAAKAAARLLRHEGYRVTISGRMEDAIGLCAAMKFDVLLIDMELPDGNGLDLLDGIRGTCTAPAIVLSGYASTELLDRAKQRGFAEYLVKPVSAVGLTEAIRRVTGGSPPAPS